MSCKVGAKVLSLECCRLSLAIGGLLELGSVRRFTRKVGVSAHAMKKTTL